MWKSILSLNEKLRKQEAAVNELLVESIMEYDAKNYKKALEKAKEAGRKERATVRFRGIHSLGEPNLDLTLTVLLNLAQQVINVVKMTCLNYQTNYLSSKQGYFKCIRLNWAKRLNCTRFVTTRNSFYSCN